ncbi:DUF2306 domain-containing protein [Halobacterium litoreum]|uniref:DUF2306 domain-containing protein n=1 Tax=Halobacterium litoreum TaxID=2039234 RepID=A0ABD5NAQ0_9EURY|nr:DUF2306 domain-containing protein [Halobacterium litoreum]UHH12060.1 DUF2306 domain-containing protein [Halobacterium litoreum]
MTALGDAVLQAHVVAGFAALFAGLGALATEKGGRRHRQSGRIYVYAMAFVSGTSLALYAVEPTFMRLFLGLVAVFSFYFAFSGYRVLGRKRPSDDPALPDWVAVGLLGAASVGLLAVGATYYLDGADFAAVVLVFGAIAGAFAVTDARKFRRERDRFAWVGEHVVRMGAGYIATVSAFSTVNFTALPSIARWLWPTVLGTPLLVYLQYKYEDEFASN